jgi:hypothetical protein
MEDLILRMDIFIDGFETIKSVPIELSGCRSYELDPTPENPLYEELIQEQKAKKKRGD